MNKKIYFASIFFCILLINSPLFGQDEDEPVAKSYKIRFKTVRQFEPLIQRILSNRGEFETSEDLNIIVVVDRPAYLTRVDSLVAYFDIPAQQFLINLQLVEGSNDPEAVASRDSTDLHTLLDQFYSFETYEELDKVIIRAEEKTATSFFLAEGQYNISFQLDYLPGAVASVRFREFTLNEVVTGVAGKTTTPIYSSSAEISEDTLQVFSAIKQEKTGKTLILVLTAHRL
jgi:type II secretory pathway component GspD/PulD (secretin)